MYCNGLLRTVRYTVLFLSLALRLLFHQTTGVINVYLFFSVSRYNTISCHHANNREGGTERMKDSVVAICTKSLRPISIIIGNTLIEISLINKYNTGAIAFCFLYSLVVSRSPRYNFCFFILLFVKMYITLLYMYNSANIIFTYKH